MIELRKAAFHGDLYTVSLYKKQREKINEPGPDSQRTALHWAAWGGHHPVVSCLVKAAKADIDPRDIDRNTPLNLAIWAHNVPLLKKLLVIDLLLTHGADPTLANKNGETPLMNLMQLIKQASSALYSHRELIKTIMRKIYKAIQAKADRLNRSFSVLPDGMVVFERGAIPFTQVAELGTGGVRHAGTSAF